MKQKNMILRSAAALLTLMLAVSSCDFLEESPVYSAKTENITTVLDGQLLTNRLYSSGLASTYESRGNGWHITRLMYGGVMSGIFVDPRKEAQFTGYVEAMNITFQTVGGEVQPFYQQAYEAIARANLIIDRVPKIPNISDADKNSLVGQALFFRALNYYTLVKEFGVADSAMSDGGGGVPLVVTPVLSTEDPAAIGLPRASITDVYKQIETDLKAVIDGNMLPNKPFYANSGRVSKVTAQSLLAIVYLQWAGYPVKDSSKYALSAAMADAVIEGGSGVALETSDNDGTNPNDQKSAYNKIKLNESSNEIIYALDYSTSLNRNSIYMNYALNDVYTGWLSNPADEESAKLSRLTVVDGAYLIDRRALYSYEADDVRGKPYNFFYDRLVINGNTYRCDETDNWFWFDYTNFLANKYSDLNVPVMRLAEIYLVGAEAHLGNGNQAKADAYVDVVRKRAFTVNGVTAASYEAPENVTISDILTERLHELPLEFKIWDDIRRTRLYPEVVSGAGASATADATDPGAARDPYVLEWTDLATSTTWNRAANGQLNSNLNALVWPLSQAIRDRNKALVQNPGF